MMMMEKYISIRPYPASPPAPPPPPRAATTGRHTALRSLAMQQQQQQNIIIRLHAHVKSSQVQYLYGNSSCNSVLPQLKQPVRAAAQLPFTSPRGRRTPLSLHNTGQQHPWPDRQSKPEV
ncbi:hypothetical protein PLESTM_001074800 [Pleodorina starrii]|nr:hypothetical protein PLESTM_001074800 [Pleodorina starrii]